MTAAATDAAGVLPSLLSVRAHMADLPQLLSHIRSACAEAGLCPAQGLRIELVLEELFTNSVMHGYAGQPDESAVVWVGCVVQAGAVTVHYEDAAAPFNPLAAPAATADAMRVGGLGLGLIAQIPDEARYDYAHGRNCLTLRFCRPVVQE